MYLICIWYVSEPKREFQLQIWRYVLMSSDIASNWRLRRHRFTWLLSRQRCCWKPELPLRLERDTEVYFIRCIFLNIVRFFLLFYKNGCPRRLLCKCAFKYLFYILIIVENKSLFASFWNCIWRRFLQIDLVVINERSRNWHYDLFYLYSSPIICLNDYI